MSNRPGALFSLQGLLFGALILAYAYPYFLDYKFEWSVKQVLERDFQVHSCVGETHRVALYFQTTLALSDRVSDSGETICKRLALSHDAFLTLTGARGAAKESLNHLDIVLLASESEFKRYASLMGYSPDVLGQYVERETPFVGYIARAFLYSKPPAAEWDATLEHEYAHFLDSRYNIHTPFHGYRLERRMLWWAEGLAEFNSLGNRNKQAERYVSQAARQGYRYIPSLRTIFRTHQQDLLIEGRATLPYIWSYAAVRYLYEEENAQYWQRLLDALRNQNRMAAMKAYYQTLDEMASKLDQPFKAWVVRTYSGI